MSDLSNCNKRIAKNTILLYIRTIFTMLISLYTSRVILDILGVENYGIYNVVGGVVAMFSIISGSLSSAISRFITFELGKGDKEKLYTVFCTSVNIQICISAVVLLLGCTIGFYFLNNYINIPDGRMGAANWVLVCSLLMFCINLISVPYNASIIAHEKISAFAYISILESVLKLVICYLIIFSPFDKLISYAISLVIIAILILIIYGIYCKRNFEECHYKFIYDKMQLKSMTAFAGLTFLTNTCWIFNTQGVNILINIYFGVAFNAARGIAMQIEGAIMQFVSNFTVAINPQITKSYAADHKDEMFTFVCRGAKFSYFLLLIFSLPIMLEAEYVLALWLKEVPENAAMFFRCAIVASIIHLLGNTCSTACLATGNIKQYVFWMSMVSCLAFPLTWIAFKLGFPAESSYIVFALVYFLTNAVRLYIMRGLLGFPIMLFMREVIYKICGVTVVSILIPIVAELYIEQSFLKFVFVSIISVASSAGAIYLLGLTRSERMFVAEKIIILKKKFFQ